MSAPMRKLQDLLSTAPSNQRETAKLPILGNKSFQNVPMEPCAIPTNQGNLGSVNFPFKNLQRNQNLFYYPLMKPNDNCYPSPMVQLTNLQAVRTNNAMFFPQSQVELDNQANIYGSNMNSEILNSLSALEGSKMSIFSQPKNLNELLQKSLLSTYSTSLSQSPFVSSNQSPHVGYNMINNSGFQASINPDYSNLLTASVLGTPVQSQPLRPQNVVPQVSQMSNEGLLLQLENLLKQENARGIKLALAGLIHQFNEGKNNNQSRDNMTLPRMQEELSQHGNQRAIPLSNGFLMNRVNRTNETNMRGLVGNNRIGAREMMMMNEASSRKKNYSIIPEEDSTGDISFNQIKHSPNQNLNQKMNSLNLNVETQDIPKHNNLNISSLPVDEELNAILEERLPHDGGAPGTYNREERTGKILKYKNKIRKWRTEHPVNRNFKGRSVVAGKKPRIKGKFVTIEEYVEYIKTTKHNEEGLQVNEPFNESTTYAESEKSNREHDLNIKEENIY